MKTTHCCCWGATICIFEGLFTFRFRLQSRLPSRRTYVRTHTFPEDLLGRTLWFPRAQENLKQWEDGNHIHSGSGSGCPLLYLWLSPVSIPRVIYYC